MKQMRLMMMAFAMILTAGATAQMRPQRITQEQMTRKMVRELMLDEKQTKKVTKLNKKFKKLIEGEQPDKAKGPYPTTLNMKHEPLTIMSKKETLKFIVQMIASIATAIVTALGATSCMGY